MPDAQAITVKLPPRFNLEGLRFHRFGTHDPTARWSPTTFSKACHTPDGPGTIFIETHQNQAHIQAWGPGAQHLLGHAEAILGLHDDPEALQLPSDDPLRKIPDKIRQLRLVTTPWVGEHLIQVILQQRVTWQEAASSFGKLCRRIKEPAPGSDQDLLLPPAPAVWGRLTAPEFAALGVEHKRAQTIREAARQYHKLSQFSAVQLREFLPRIRGVAVWTTEVVMGMALGDPDAVPLGDYDLPSRISHNLVGEARADDERMLQLLEPYKGQRYRVIRWLMTPGFDPPRFGPKMARSRALGTRP